MTDPGTDDLPRVKCPRCGHKEPDLDGFGFQCCDACGYCLHPHTTRPAAGGPWVCQACGAEVPEF